MGLKITTYVAIMCDKPKILFIAFFSHKESLHNGKANSQWKSFLQDGGPIGGAVFYVPTNNPGRFREAFPFLEMLCSE